MSVVVRSDEVDCSSPDGCTEVVEWVAACVCGVDLLAFGSAETELWSGALCG